MQNDRDKREQELDSLKSTFYAGESSVSYNLKDRYARFLPIPVFKCEYGGKVVVEILVNPKGVVQKAKILEDQSQSDDCLWRLPMLLNVRVLMKNRTPLRCRKVRSLIIL